MTPSPKAVEVAGLIAQTLGLKDSQIPGLELIIQAAIDEATKEQMLDTIRLLATVFTNGKSILGGSPPPVEWTPQLLANVIARNLAESRTAQGTTAGGKVGAHPPMPVCDHERLRS